MKQIERPWLCLPALAMYCCDVSITLASQRPEFWAGAYDTVEEGNPVARLILVFGPGAFITAAVLWALTFSLAIVCGHRSLALALSCGLTIAHALGTAFWLPRHGAIGIAAAIGVLLAAERLLSWSWARSIIECKKNGPQELGDVQLS